LEFVSLDEARRSQGLRLVVIGGVPSPWGEAAKGLVHVAGVPCVAVRAQPGDAEVAAWTGQASFPVALYADESPRGGWAESLLLIQRLAPAAGLIPSDCERRAELFGLAHEICGEMGLGWCRRLAGVAASFESGGRIGFPEPIARYLADRYGYRPGIEVEARARVATLLEMLARRLHARRRAGSPYYLGDALSALDVYSATFMALFRPLPPEQCAMPEALRAAYETPDPATDSALDPILLEHRDLVYARHLELPVPL
jgi:glutathione S-transferase